MTDGDAPTPPDDDQGMPRWVKAFVAIGAVAVVAVAVLAIAGGGGHGPGRHGAAPVSGAGLEW